MRHYLTPNVLEILELLARYRYLRMSFIYQLLPHRSQRGMRATMLRMRENGYIALPRSQWRGYNSMYCCFIYEITPKGLQALKDKRPDRMTNLLRVREDVPVRNFAHSMMICDTLASLEIGIKAAGCTLIALDTIMERATGDMRLPCRIKGQRTRLLPDGLFGIRTPDNKAYFYVLEAEHYNPIETTDFERASFIKKAYGYHSIAGDRPYIKQLSIPNLRYLFVFPSASRATKAASLVTEKFAGTDFSKRVYMTDIPVQEETFKAPPPFPELLNLKWLGNGTILPEQ